MRRHEGWSEARRGVVASAILFALLRLTYQADLCKMPALARLDGIARKEANEWLHLPLLACDGLIYCQNWNRGLGVRKLVKLIPSKMDPLAGIISRLLDVTHEDKDS